MAKDALFLVLKLAKEAEEKASLQFRSAQMNHQKSRTQLDTLNNYRLDYMKQMGDKVGSNLTASHYQQFHQFIGQIDSAISQQVHAVQQAKQHEQQQQQLWLEKQQKRKAVATLLDKKAQRKQAAESKAEQKMLDEFAVQQFYRNR
ncbi:MAG: flagellar export protein FliJ [Parashewanella sp.]